MEIRKIVKDGNSKAVHLPSAYCRKLALDAGHFVVIRCTVDGEIVLRKYNPEAERGIK